jgi:hypothetical protein
MLNFANDMDYNGQMHRPARDDASGHYIRVSTQSGLLLLVQDGCDPRSKEHAALLVDHE